MKRDTQRNIKLNVLAAKGYQPKDEGPLSMARL